MSDPYDVVRQFEEAIGIYTGAPYVVSCSSCTMALLLVMDWHVWKRWPPSWQERSPWIEIPKKTYVSVPQSVIHACGPNPVRFRDEEWVGSYQLKPLPIWDCARRFTSGMYRAGCYQCLSFHWSKILGLGQGGAILHDNPEADIWLRKARFDGRTEGIAPKDDTFDVLGWHAYMSPETAAHGLMNLSVLPKDNPDLPNDEYPDLSQMEIFK